MALLRTISNTLNCDSKKTDVFGYALIFDWTFIDNQFNLNESIYKCTCFNSIWLAIQKGCNYFINVSEIKTYQFVNSMVWKFLLTFIITCLEST